MDDAKNAPQPIADAALDDAAGGLLLPAVQKVREAAVRYRTGATPDANADGASFGDGSV